MTKVLFYYDTNYVNGSVYLCTAHLYLKTYIDVTDPEISKKIHWVLPQQTRLSNEDLIKMCNDNDIDLLCTSHYVWNTENLMKQLREIRPHLNEKIKFVAGGPSVTVHIDDDYFENFPFIDYAVYGAGEKAFYDLLKSIEEKRELNHLFTSNVAWADKKNKKKKIANYQYVPMIKSSPFLHNRKMFEESVQKEFSNGNKFIQLPYDTTRGCPYACTFCDWNSGLGNKVSKRVKTYQEEIDLFFKLNITQLHMADANIGLYSEDVDMMDYLADKNLENNCQIGIVLNLSKLSLKNNRKIYRSLARGKLLMQGFPISCQDIHEEVLKNINRPDITWAEHSAIIDELEQEFPEYTCQVQLIQGLPGQTVESWRETLRQVCSKNVIPMVLVSEWLPASPAALDPDYQKKWNFTYSRSLRSMGEYFQNNNTFFRGIMAESCKSFTKNDYIEMTMLSQLYTVCNMYKFFLKRKNIFIDTSQIVDHLEKTDFYKNLKQNLQTNWDDDKFYYTIDFSGNHSIISACTTYSTAQSWANDFNLKTIVSNYITDDHDKKMFLDFNFDYYDYDGYYR
jgi:tRNA A37 methylthiotransferase MiaB